MSRRNDPTIHLWHAADPDTAAADRVRNGDRWRAAAIDPATGRVAAKRLTDRARTIFDADYGREYVTHGYASTVHTAQGYTADSTHAVPGENATRSLSYVAMTRARDANTAYLYERANEQGYGPTTTSDEPHVLQRATSQHGEYVFWQQGAPANSIVGQLNSVSIGRARAAPE